MKHTKSFIAILVAFISFGSFAQKDNETQPKKLLDPVMKQTTSIFEGKLVSSTSFTTSAGEIYSSALINVEEVIRGSLKKGTVEINELIGRIDKDGNKESFHSSSPTKRVNTVEGTAVYFCSNDKNTPANSAASKTNLIPIKVYEVVSFSQDKIKSSSSNLEKHFKTLPDLYQYLSTNYNITIDKTLLEKKSPIITEVSKTSSIYNNGRAENAKKLLESIRFRTKKPVKANKIGSTAPGDLFLDLVNPVKTSYVRCYLLGI